MAGKIVADTLEHSTAGSVDTQYVVNGSAKAWATLDGTGTIAFRDSFNHSSSTDNGTGDYTFTFTNALSNRNRCVNYTINYDEGTGRPYVPTEIGTPSSTTSRVDNSVSNSPSDADCEDCYLTVHGDLA
tara:strand:- start:156 stop:542 length:387 start_codon:yes stop_codon:yes gene_type:complete